MNDPQSQKPQEPLGAGNLVGASVRELFRNFVPLFLISALVMVPYVLVSDHFSNVYAQRLALGAASVNGPGRIVGVYLVVVLLTMILGVLAQSFVLVVAAQILRDGRANIPAAAARLLAGAVPLVLLSILYYIVIGVGFVAFIVPGIWIAAAWLVFTPAILIEQKGFGGIGRSIELTKGYRWPIVGAGLLLFLVLVVAAIPSLLISGVLGTGASFGALEYNQPIWVSLVNGLISSATTPLIALFLVLLHSRLVQIKEGGGFDVAAVFD